MDMVKFDHKLKHKQRKQANLSMCENANLSRF